MRLCVSPFFYCVVFVVTYKDICFSVFIFAVLIKHLKFFLFSCHTPRKSCQKAPVLLEIFSCPPAIDPVLYAV